MMELRSAECLLDRLAQSTGRHYLSDLRLPELASRLAQEVSDIPARDYPLSQWTKAAAYIFEAPCPAASPEQARQWFLQQLAPQNE